MRMSEFFAEIVHHTRYKVNIVNYVHQLRFD